ncbi:MAG: DNA-directed RNA polymerase subunit A'' [Candidatus Methanomethylophilaceae archaeon]|nr:DNA-directed RNA polymerase subunit A'' [Candidatus Methanomethylophilaceae archaeon]MDY5872006.1 DNA-directed RNA polymerase subunit A'' [Candidatus Methanomethylophilaceae archaeon]
MARKDTEKALLVRGVAPELVAKLLDGFNTIQSIKDAGVDGIKEKGFSDEDAADIHSKVAGSTKRSTTRVKKVTDAVKAEDVNVVPMTLITNKHHVASDLENNLISIRDEMGSSLPLKVIVDIASRIEGTEYAEDEETQRKLVEVADRMFREHKMASHESAGVMAAHSIGEPGTQMNMRTFHNAGVANVLTTQGLPRLIEIVDARRIPSTPSMTIPLRGLAAEDESIAKLVSYEIETTILKNVADISVDATNMRVVITPDSRVMSERKITRDDILERLNKVKLFRGLVQLSGDFDVVIVSDVPSFKKLQTLYETAKLTRIKGIDGIKRAVLSKQKMKILKSDSGDGTDANRVDGMGWAIVTEGSNLKEVLKVEGVDVEYAQTNSILEIAEVLGIEAARNSIIKEALATMKGAGMDVDIRHIMLVADLMTNDGSVKAIGRHGISGKKASVLARAAFEITAPHLLHAAMIGEIDHLEGVAENIIVGQPVTLGTGAVNLIYTPKNQGNKE